MLFLQAFVFFWVFELIQAIFNYILIVGVCTWYFTSNQDVRGEFSLCKGMEWAFVYNFGSLAFGSFVLAVIWIIRITLELIDRQMKEAKENNQVVAAISACVRCCMDCFHRFVKFLNENAYI